jgi:putative salt-induced outer membrane protein YdiY
MRGRGFLPAILLALALPPPGAGQAILNVERLQSGEVEGLHGELATRLNLAGGNTDLFQVGGSLGVGFRAPRHWTRTFLGIDWLRKNGEDLVDNRYVHFRYNFFFREELRTFHFLQLQTNLNLLIKRRWLVGSGLRVRALAGESGRLDLGSGVMYEAETLQEDALGEGEEPNTRTVRLSNLLVASWDPLEGTRLVAVIYHQPDVRRLDDYRLSGELALAVDMTRSLGLEVALDWRHDSRAPGSLEDDDLGLRTGITYRLR